MGKSEKTQGLEGDNTPGFLLRNSSQWRVWISHIRSAAVAEDVWDYLDPDKTEAEILKVPTLSSRVWPEPSLIKPGAVSATDLDARQLADYKDMLYLFKEERSFKHSISKAVARIQTKIKDWLAPEWHGILADVTSPYHQLVRLKQQFAPKKNTRVQDLRNDWRKMVDSPIGRTSLERWLLNWSNLYDEAKAAKVPDVCYTDEEYPPDSMAIRDLLQAIQTQDPYFANQWRQRLTDWEDVRHSTASGQYSTALVVMDRRAPTFHSVLSDYRDHRQVQNQAQNSSGAGSLSFTATLNGQLAGRRGDNSKKKACLCGNEKHEPKECWEINWTLRPGFYNLNAARRKVIEENLKKASPQLREEVEKMMSTDPARSEKPAAQLAIQAPGDDLPTNTIAFFTATISPEVYHAAATYSLRANWIIDSGANVHICNQKDRFTSLRKEATEITMGSGAAMSQGRGTARIIVRNPGNGQVQWATLQDVWYAPEFATNIISVSEIKKNGFFFTSELPGIVTTEGPVAVCQEKHGLYILEQIDSTPKGALMSDPAALATVKMSEKPQVSSATAEIWHRRLGHLYPRRVETLPQLVDGVIIKEISEESQKGALTDLPEVCEVCQITELKRQVSRRSANREVIFGRYGRIHFDIFEINEAWNGDKYASHLYIEGIRFHLIETHKTKDGCVTAIIRMVGFCQNQLGIQIRAFMTDGERSLGNAFKLWCGREGIIFQDTVPGTPEQNGFSERAGRLIIVVARRLIHDANLPKNLWPEAVRAAVYILNRTPTMLPDHRVIVPWVEAMKAKTPAEAENTAESNPLRANLANLRLYGCRAYVRTQKIPKKDKMAPRAEIGYLVGYVASNIWRIWFPHLDTVRACRDVVFDESRQYRPEEADTTIPQDVRRAMPWAVPEWSEEDEYQGVPPVSSGSDVVDDTSVPQPDNNSVGTHEHSTIAVEHHDNARAFENNDRVITDNKTPDRNVFPSPSPTPQAPRHTEVPGSFPIEPSPSPVPLEAEGVSTGDRRSESPENQLQSELRSTADSPPPPGYREYGAKAPRDISADFSADNIIHGTRTRGKKVHFGVATEEHLVEDPDESNQGVLMAFTAAISAPGPHRRPHRDDLPQEPKNWHELVRHPHSDGFAEAARSEIKNLKAKGTFEEVDRPSDVSKQVLPLTWVFTYKFDEDGFLVKYKARICVRGDLQIVTTEEKYSATLAVRTARMILALAAAFDLDTVQLDAVNAFLNSTLPDEVYVELPPGLFPKQANSRCWRLIKALYGLRKSPRLWQQEATRVLGMLGFKIVYEDVCLMVSPDGLLVIFYVDDILIFSPKNMKQRAADAVAKMAEHWELRQMGEAKWFLGIRILRDRQRGLIWLCQDAYIASMAARYHLTEGRKFEIPPVSIAEMKPYDGVALPGHKHEFAQKVGSAQYATTTTRVDAAKATSHLAQFLSNPSTDHLNAINQVISYLYHTRARAICYRAPTEEEISQTLRFFSDASYGDNPDRKSSAGFICMAFGGPIDWKATKQKTVTTSTTEAELLAMSEAAKSLMMWRRLFKTIGFDPGHPITLRCDNSQTIGLLTKESPQLRTKLRHVDIHRHWLRQEVQDGRLPVEWVKTSDMVADGLTKVLPRQKHLEFVRMLGMEDIDHLIQPSSDGS
jgi:hypothetical protein